jgi:hypothetical protein
MCFSASASFGAGVVLSVFGVAAIRKAKHPSQYLFAGIPLIFAVQQLAEGCLWLLLPNPDYATSQHIFTYIFLCFAQIIWPAWVPLAFLLLEKESTRDKLQRILVGMGLLVSVYLGVCLLSYPVQAKLVNYHVTYEQSYPPAWSNIIAVIYLIATIAPPFFSHIKKMWLLGSAILISYIITAIFYDNYLVSVWCFFASVISFSVYIIMLEIEKMPTRASLSGNRPEPARLA